MILIKNGNLISLDNNKKTIVHNIDILIENGKVIKIDKNIIEQTCKVIDATNKYIMPGLINCHAHVPMILFKETFEGCTLQEWLQNKIWPAESKLTEEDIYYASLMSFIEMIKTGTTTVNDHYFMTDEIIKAGFKIGINMIETVCLMDMDGNGDERLKKFIKLLNDYPNVNISVALHGLYTCSEDIVEKAVQIAESNNKIVHMHYLENINEIKDIMNNYNGIKPTEILNTYFTKTKNVFAHCVKVSNEDLDFFEKTDTSVVHCPVSNLKLGCGIAKIDEMLKRGINVCLGTDGQGSSSNVDMFEQMKFASLLQKGVLEDPSCLDSYKVLEMATINGAKALNINNRGIIKEGNIADLIILDLNTAVTAPNNNTISNIVNNAKGTNVITSIINGQIVMEDRKIVNINEEDIMKQIDKIKNRIMEV